MGGIISVVLAYLFRVVASFYTVIVNHFLATKIILTTLFIVVLPVVIFNVVTDIIEILVDFANAKVQSVEVNSSLFTVYQFTGLAGWLIQAFKIPEAFSVVVSGIVCSLVLRSIPFVRW